MGFSSYSDLISELSTGKYFNVPFLKATSNAGASTAGRWHELYTATGNPPAGVLATSAGSSMALSGTSGPPGANYGPYLGGNVSPDTKHILSVQLFSPTATMVPNVAILCDFLVGTALCTASTPTTITTAGLPSTRYADGIGVQLLAATSVVFGAATTTITPTCTYDDNTNAAGGVLTAAASQPVSTILTNASNPFMPLPVGKKGVKSVNSYTSTGSNTGQFSFYLVKPLLSIPLVQQYAMSERDLVVQLPSMPRVYDGAFLAWVIMPGGAMVASAVLGGMIGVGWG